MQPGPGTMVDQLSPEECREAAETVRSGYYLGPSFANMMSACGSFVFFWLIYAEFRFRIHYHINAKILIMLNMLANLSFSTATMFTYGLVFINTIVASNDCDFFFYTHNCSNLRFMFLFSIMLTTMSHISLVVERVYATIKLGKYEECGKRLGTCFAVISLVCSYGAVKAVTFSEDPNERVTNCFAFSTTKSIGGKVYYMFICQFLLEVFTWIIYCVLKKYHTNKLRNHIDGHLQERFQAEENELVLRQLAPLILISSGLILIYICFSSVGHYFMPAFTLPHYKQFASFIFVMPHNAFITMAMFYIRFRRALVEKQLKMQEALTSPITLRKPYMEHLNEFWNSHYVKKGNGQAQVRVEYMA